MNKKTIKDFNLEGKKVLIRVDFNVPIENGKITSNKRIQAALPTIQFAIENEAKIVLFSHLGRVKNEDDKKKNSLEPVAKELSRLLGKDVIFVNQTRGSVLEETINNLKPKQVLMVQNTRYEDLENKKESNNDLELGKYWASLGDIFINDAFGTAHRSHASNVGIANNVSASGVGFLIEKELEMLSKALNNFEKPFIAIIGGAKVSDKIKVIENMLKKADQILIGGAMAYTFLKSQEVEIGKSLLEKEYIDLAKELLDKNLNKIVLPIDHAVASEYKDEPREETKGIDIEPNKMALDIGPKTIDLYTKKLQGAKTVVWNGPMGVAEFKNFKLGTEKVAQAIANQQNIFSIIGGGDSAAAAINLGFEDKFSHISTGGGASLEFMEGKKLPGIEAIQNREKNA